MRSARFLLVCLLAALLQACAHAPRLPQAATQQEVEQSFVLNGRMAIRHRGEHSTATVRWEHQPGRDDILLLAPLGITVAHVRHNAGGVTMESGGRQYQSRDVESLMDSVIGWHLPLDELYAWARGRAYPGSIFEAGNNEHGQLAWLSQDGWSIRYQRYQGEAVDSLPLKMLLRHDDLDLQLVIDEWELATP
jgi:outer membrane lipoprotein LolB